MKRRTAYAAICMLSVLGASMTMSAAAMAEELTETAEVMTEAETAEMPAETEEPELVAVSYEQDGAWDQVAITNKDTVTTGINIRSAADQDSEVLGYLYEGTAVWVLNKGEEWTEFYSNGITGYVMNAYLLYGDSVSEAASEYGVQGVRTEWAGAKAYASASGDSQEVATLGENESYIVLADEGHWLKIQLNDGVSAYVSSDDVSKVILFESATEKDGERYHLIDIAAELGVSYVESYDYEENTEETYPEETYTEEYVPETSAPQPEYIPETSAPQTEYVPETSAPQTEYVPETSAPQTEYVPETDAAEDTGDADGGYYDADTDTYYDADGNVIQKSTAAAYDDAAVYSAVLEEVYYEETEPVYEEYQETEAAYEEYYEETEAVTYETYDEETEAASTSTDDTSLLAALIYCEAGNQSYEGMVAVGAVVMNRVNSSSFPNTISEVIYQSGQFTPAYSGTLASALANGVPSTCYEAAAAAINGENPVGSALYFNTSAGTGIQIGDHWFY